MTKDPAISILMAVYNNEAFLREAIDSILSQTFTDFEFIIVNDASTDNSSNVLRGFDDKRITIINNEKNIGLTKSLNKAITIAKGKYIARMDSDDISFPQRLEKQFEFMEKNPVIALCGCQVTAVTAPDEPGAFPFEHGHIKVRALESNPFAHPTVMWRRKVFIDHNLFYNEDYRYAQDYELWSRVLMQVETANLTAHLFSYRDHVGQVGKTKKAEQDTNAEKVQLILLNNLGIHPTGEETALHFSIFGSGLKKHRNASDLKKIEAWLLKLIAANDKLKIFSRQELVNQWGKKIFKKGLYKYNFSIWYWSLSSISRKSSRISIWDKLAFFIKSMIGKENK